MSRKIKILRAPNRAEDDTFYDAGALRGAVQSLSAQQKSRTLSNMGLVIYSGECSGTSYIEESGTPTLINFTIYHDNHLYQAEEGMTWVEWWGSEYNTTAWGMDKIGSDGRIQLEPRDYLVYSNGDYVYANDTIIANEAYTTSMALEAL